MRTNTYDAASGTVTLSAERVAAYRANSAHYAETLSLIHI